MKTVPLPAVRLVVRWSRMDIVWVYELSGCWWDSEPKPKYSSTRTYTAHSVHSNFIRFRLLLPGTGRMSLGALDIWADDRISQNHSTITLQLLNLQLLSSVSAPLKLTRTFPFAHSAFLKQF